MNHFDVVVVGGGLAGVCAAEHALRGGAATALVTKGWLGAVGVRGSGASACGASEGGVPSFHRLLEESFDPDAYQEKIIGAGLGVVEPAMVEFFVEQFLKLRPRAGELMSYYEQPGPFSLGAPLVHSYLNHVRRGAAVYAHTTVCRLLTRDRVCHGVLCVDETSGTVFPLYARAVVLAAGGDAGLFSVNVHPEGVTGDGYAVGLRGGAEAVNLEFMQIFTMTTAPTRNLLHFWTEEYLEKLYNARGEEFLGRYLPEGISVQECVRQNILHAPFSVRDRASRYLAISIVEEVKAGRGTPSGGILVDLRGCASFKGSPQDRFFRYRGIDASSRPLEVSMGFQCCNGGLRVDRRMGTAVEGLFAAGENAGGLHGADRLGGNMLAGCVITGRVAGEQAASRAKARARWEKVRYSPTTSVAGNPPLAEQYGPLFGRLRRSAWANLLLVKSEQSIRRFLDLVEEIEREAVKMAGNAAAVPVELENLLILGKVVAAAAAARRESRGGFYRADHPVPGQAPPRVRLLSLTETGAVHSREEVFDPEWDARAEDPLGGERWG